MSVNNNGSWNGSKVTITDQTVDLSTLGVISISGNATLSKTVTYKGQTFTVFVKAIYWDDGDNDGYRSEWWMTSNQHVHEFHRGETYGDQGNQDFRFKGEDYTAPGSAIRFDPNSDANLGNLDFAIEFHRNPNSEGNNYTVTSDNDQHTIALSGDTIDYTR